MSSSLHRPTIKNNCCNCIDTFYFSLADSKLVWNCKKHDMTKHTITKFVCTDWLWVTLKGNVPQHWPSHSIIFLNICALYILYQLEIKYITSEYHVLVNPPNHQHLLPKQTHENLHAIPCSLLTKGLTDSPYQSCSLACKPVS